MKKATMNTILSLIATIDTPEAEAVRAEIAAELDKGKAKAEANRQVYAELREKVIDTLRTAAAPVTAQEIADAIGESRGKIVYGLTNYWSAEIVKDSSGKTTTYTLA